MSLNLSLFTVHMATHGRILPKCQKRDDGIGLGGTVRPVRATRGSRHLLLEPEYWAQSRTKCSNTAQSYLCAEV